MIKVEKSNLDDLDEIYEIEKSVFKNYWSKPSLKKELEYFLDCIESKEEIKIANGSNALKVIRILSDASDDL